MVLSYHQQYVSDNDIAKQHLRPLRNKKDAEYKKQGRFKGGRADPPLSKNSGPPFVPPPNEVYGTTCYCGI